MFSPFILMLILLQAGRALTSSTTSTLMTTVDANNHAPVFTSGQVLNVSILDTKPAGEEVLNVTATDKDTSPPNNEITYSLNGTDNEHFTIDNTGSIKVATPSQLDYTTKSQYFLVVIATDKATSNEKSATANFTITLETAPMFIKPPDGSTVLTESEDLGNGKSLYDCIVVDKDGNVGTLNLTVHAVVPSSGKSLFRMEGVNLRTSDSVASSTFDLEAVNATSSYLLTIRVSDGKYYADINIRVNITDINDNNPIFSGDLAQTINDTLSIGQDVTTAVAADADVSSQYNSVTYSIQSANGLSGDYTYFTINATTGVLTLAKEPLKTTYILTMKAKDVGNREGTTTLTITVADTVDECLSSPCQNAGTCYNNINYFFCDCVNGWAGRICETNINDCDPNPCENNGECTDGLASFTCNCSAGWTGDNCTQVCTNNQHGRNCAQTCQCNETRLASGTDSQKCNITSGDCFCNDMWSGNVCQTDVDECAANTTICSGGLNQACENSRGSFECVCKQGYTLNSTDVCVATIENTTVPVNGECSGIDGELLVKCTITQTGLTCPDLTIPSEYNNLQNSIKNAESQQRFSNVSVECFNISCGSLIYDLYIVIDDTAAAKETLAQDLNNISKGLTLVLNNETTVTSALTISGKQVPITTSADSSVQICSVYTAFSPCGSDYECKIRDGTPFCQQKETDRTNLIVGLALGVPLGILAVIAVIVMLCYFRKNRYIEEDAGNRSEERTRASRRSKSSKQNRDESHSRIKSKYADLYPKSSDLPYTSIDYDNYAVDPAWSRQDLSKSQQNWMFYKPNSRNNDSTYRQSQRHELYNSTPQNNDSTYRQSQRRELYNPAPQNNDSTYRQSQRRELYNPVPQNDSTYRQSQRHELYNPAPRNNERNYRQSLRY